jgi:hypothetical protein
MQMDSLGRSNSWQQSSVNIKLRVGIDLHSLTQKFHAIDEQYGGILLYILRKIYL